MLNKNIYITYPAGYHGSYIHWAINKSNISTSANTVDDPLNLITSDLLGGKGTAHQHIKIPTHHGIDRHLAWIIKNKPTHSLIYPTNINNKQPDRTTEASIQKYMITDDRGVFINIHDNNQFETKAYGIINCVIKWPTYMAIVLKKRGLSHIDSFNCQQNREFRNLAVNVHKFVMTNSPINRDILANRISIAQDWYDIRHEFQPHEVNDQYYITDYNLSNRLFEISCDNIVSLKFISFLEKFFEDSNISDDWDTSFVEQYHPTYINAQPNLQWFDSFANWKKTGELDDYLTSHVIIEAQLIKYILYSNKAEPISGWEALSIQEINNLYQQGDL